MGPGITVVEIERPLDFLQRVVEGHAFRHFEKRRADDCPRNIGVRTCVVLVERDRGAKAFPGFGQTAPVQPPPLFVAEEDEVVGGHVRRLLSNRDVADSVFQPARQARDHRPCDLVLHGKDVRKRAVIALAPELIALCASTS